MFTPHLDSPQVRIPPPLAVAFVNSISILLMYLVPSPFLSPTFRWTLGTGLFLSGIALAIWCASIFKKYRTGIAPWTPTLVLFYEGPYKLSRNPIYIAAIMVALGVICLVNNAISLFLLVPLFIFLDVYVVRREENYLLKKFGQQYEEYLKKTRRWI